MKSSWTFKDQRRFWTLVDTSPVHGGCWVWRGADDGRFGHGKFKVGGVSVRAIRWIVSLYDPKALAGKNRRKVVRHTCDNPKCVRPDHLVPGTQRQNVGDAMSRGRHRIPKRQKRASKPQLKLAFVREKNSTLWMCQCEVHS
jgi:hypothetical protein